MTRGTASSCSAGRWWQRDPLAWDALYFQYGPLVGRWIQQHPGFDASGEEIQYFTNRAFEKIWAALTPEKFGQFPDLGFLLRYLKMCVHSAISDHNRSAEQAVAEQAVRVDLDEEPVLEIRDTAQGPEDRALGRIQRLRFWEALNERLNDEKERQVIYGSYMLALKPGELIDAFPGAFADADEVYRIKQNVLARLRRDVELGEGAGSERLSTRSEREVTRSERRKYLLFTD